MKRFENAELMEQLIYGLIARAKSCIVPDDVRSTLKGTSVADLDARYDTYVEVIADMLGVDDAVVNHFIQITPKGIINNKTYNFSELS